MRPPAPRAPASLLLSRFVPLLGLALLWLGCSPTPTEESLGDGGAAGPDAQGSAAYPPYDPAAPALCGQPAYTLRPASEVGKVLQSADGLTKTAVETAARIAILKAAGYANIRRAPTYNIRTAVIRYQTQDRGKLVDATAMVAWPVLVLPGARPFPMTIFLHPTLGYVDACAPSPSVKDSLQPMTLLAELSASFGYVAVLPDYLNMRSLGAPSASVTPTC